MKRACWLLSLVLLMLASAIPGQDAAKLAERLHAADTGSALDAPDMKPWHMKMTVQLFDSRGKPSDQGTIEEWWGSPELDRREYRTNAYSATEIRRDDKVYRTSGADLPPYYLEVLRRQVVRPIPPTRGDASTFRPELRKLNVGKIALECIAERSAKADGPLVLGADLTYCFTDGSDSLRLSLVLSSEEIVRSATGRFQGKEVAVDAVVSTNTVRAASEHIDILAAMTIPQSEFEPSADTPEVVPPIVSEGEDAKLEGEDAKLETQGGAVTQAQPIFPQAAKERNLAGRVVLRAIIGANGTVRDVSVISSSDPLFVDSATTAVRRWRFKPSTRNGQPVEVETIVVVNFSIS